MIAALATYVALIIAGCSAILFAIVGIGALMRPRRGGR